MLEQTNSEAVLKAIVDRFVSVPRIKIQYFSGRAELVQYRMFTVRSLGSKDTLEPLPVKRPPSYMPRKRSKYYNYIPRAYTMRIHVLVDGDTVTVKHSDNSTYYVKLYKASDLEMMLEFIKDHFWYSKRSPNTPASVKLAELSTKWHMSKDHCGPLVRNVVRDKIIAELKSGVVPKG